MTTCLVRPPVLVPKFNMALTLTPPLGLAYVAGSLRAAGVGLHVIDGVGEGLEDVEPAGNDCFIYGKSIRDIVEMMPDETRLVGVSAQYSFEWPIYKQLCALIRSRFPGALIMAGGEHITAMPRESLTTSAIDVCVLGEGEATATEIATAFSEDRLDLAAVQGICYKGADGTLHETVRRARIRDIDAIARPAWDIFPIEQYLDRNLSFGVDRGRSMPVLASRGCPYQCAFCSNKNMWSTMWRVRDKDLLLDELAFYQQRYAITNFDFYDLTAVINKKWIIDFCASIHERGMEFTWQLPSGTRSEALDRESATAMYNAGCRNLSFSPESGSPTVLKLIRKQISLDAMETSMRQCVVSGLNIKTNIIFGFPGETYRCILESLVYIARMALIGVHDLSIWAFSPYPGSILFDKLRSRGRIRVDDDYFDSLRSYADASKTVSYSAHISDRALKRLRVVGTLLFYLTSYLVRPWRLFITVRNVLTGKQESRFEMALAKTLQRARQNRALKDK